MVCKKDGSWRFCVNYRKLDSLTQKDVYLLPLIEVTLTFLTQGLWLTTLLPGKTAFTTPLRLYDF